MDMNTGSTNLQVSKIEILVLRNELFALRDRVTNLEKQLLNCNKLPAEGCMGYPMETCVFCQGSHHIRSCEYFKYLQVADRWALAKKLNLCYRCLESSHYGLNCPQSKMCGVNRCRLTHNELLHDEEKRKNLQKLKATRRVQPSAPSSSKSVIDRQPSQIEDLSGIESDQDSLDSSGEECGEPGRKNGTSNLDLFYDECLFPENQVDPDIIEIDKVESNFNPQTIACDGRIDSENMDELNRLAMLAETDVPFDVIFGGSCGKELGSSQSRNLISNSFEPSRENNPVLPSDNEIADITGFEAVCNDGGVFKNNEVNSLDSSYNENVDPAVKHPCPIEVVVNFNPENGYETDSSEVHSLDPITPGGYDPFRPSGGEDKTVDLEPEDKGGGPFQCSPLIMAMYNSGMFYNKCRMPPEYQNSINEKLDEKFEKETSSGGENDGPKLEASSPEPNFAVQLERLIQSVETDTSKMMLLDALSNQVYKLDKEIHFYENATALASPVEEGQRQIDLSTWLMPIPTQEGPN